MGSYSNLAIFGSLIEEPGKGILVGEVGDFPLVWYQIDRKQLQQIKRGMEILAGIYLAAGAQRIIPQLHRPIELFNWNQLRQFSQLPINSADLDLSGFHPLGTARVGSSEQNGVVDQRGKVFSTENLYVADGSIIPTSPGVNPQITIMSAAAKISSQIF